MSLKLYHQKRNFQETSEPKPQVIKTSFKQEYPLFCVQKHATRHLHFDFRLEHKGVLLSWAIPKDPSMDPSQKRSAIQVEEHPLDYGSF